VGHWVVHTPLGVFTTITLANRKKQTNQPTFLGINIIIFSFELNAFVLIVLPFKAQNIFFLEKISCLLRTRDVPRPPARILPALDRLQSSCTLVNPLITLWDS